MKTEQTLTGIEFTVAQADIGSEARRSIGQVATVVLETEVLGLNSVGQGHDDVVRLFHAPDDLTRSETTAQPRQQLYLLEGLGDEVVGTGIKGRDHV